MGDVTSPSPQVDGSIERRSSMVRYSTGSPLRGVATLIAVVALVASA